MTPSRLRAPDPPLTDAREVVVSAASGGVGQVAGQLAKLAGARVVAEDAHVAQRVGVNLEGVTPGLKIAINSTPTHFFGTRYPIECQKVSYTL